MLLQMEDFKGRLPSPDTSALLCVQFCSSLLSFHSNLSHLFLLAPYLHQSVTLSALTFLCSLYFYTLVVLLFKTILGPKGPNCSSDPSQGQEFPWFWLFLIFVFLVLTNRSVTPIMISEPCKSWMQLPRTENLWKGWCVTRVNNAFQK